MHSDTIHTEEEAQIYREDNRFRFGHTDLEGSHLSRVSFKQFEMQIYNLQEPSGLRCSFGVIASGCHCILGLKFLVQES